MQTLTLIPAVDTDKKAVRTAYHQALIDLHDIQDKASWTNTEAVAAIKSMAGLQEKMLRFIAGSTGA